MQVLDEHQDAGSGVGPADADVVEPASVAEGELAVSVDAVSQDQSMTQNWVDLVSGSLTSQGNDLQGLANAFQPYPADSSPLATAGQQLSTDVFTFTADQESGLQPGWLPEYRALQHDIAALGGMCDTPYSLPSGEYG